MNVPFRWDLVAPDQLGSMLDGVATPDPWYLGDLAECAGKVLARSGNGDLVFVGRSLDSMFDLLGGALPDRTLARLPVSFYGSRTVARENVPHARELAAAIGITPAALARRDRPVTFVDVVHGGSTFTKLFTILDDWIAEERETWPVIRHKLRFVGITIRMQTSPKTWRWQQHAAWTRRLPAGAVVNVSLDSAVWSYFGDEQPKLTRSYQLHRWREYLHEVRRDEHTREALAEAVHLVSLGRTKEVRRLVARGIDGEPALTEPWLRTLFRQLSA
ncbi:hypothetical protein C8D88_105521 [Lentzea atacamensis]|uniref:Uncharacterized protein n=1 Tax=Lentzea atacamensis TaxID=531938 RepID=A0A316IGT0_9PSEU|nr:hypothetical protein [Lentzea atacamensis]PWK86472.1 hypothetical protein C8D88_105521 [Lentzea atacamensis]RAS59852.1 hypothetical protein C8D87_113158 [Lentzea atacamensis]